MYKTVKMVRTNFSNLNQIEQDFKILSNGFKSI
jgi:hypothetical protein